MIAAQREKSDLNATQERIAPISFVGRRETLDFALVRAGLRCSLNQLEIDEHAKSGFTVPRGSLFSVAYSIVRHEYWLRLSRESALWKAFIVMLETHMLLTEAIIMLCDFNSCLR